MIHTNLKGFRLLQFFLIDHWEALRQSKLCPLATFWTLEQDISHSYAKEVLSNCISNKFRQIISSELKTLHTYKFHYWLLIHNVFLISRRRLQINWGLIESYDGFGSKILRRFKPGTSKTGKVSPKSQIFQFFSLCLQKSHRVKSRNTGVKDV